MSLPVKKVYVDSRFRTSDSLSTSSFKFQLARNLYMPKNTVFYIEDVCIPNTWLTIEEGQNNRLYYQYIDSNGYVYPTSYVLLSPSQYTATTLATEVQKQLNTDSRLAGQILVTANTMYNNITIQTSNSSFYLLTDDDLRSVGLNISDLLTCNNVIGNTTGAGTVVTKDNPFTSGFLQLTHNNVYLSSPNLGTYTTLGARGESNILKKIPVTSGYGYLIVDQYTSNHDFLDCSEQTLSTLEFNVKDVEGNILNLHGYNVSFSIVFSNHSEDGPR